MSKIHPLFEKAIWSPFGSFIGEKNPIDEWRAAGKPVVVEEGPLPWGQPIGIPTREEPEPEYQGVPWKLYPFSSADEAKKLLAQKDAKIRELEEKLKDPLSYLGPNGEVWTRVPPAKDVWNAALEEAAKAWEGVYYKYAGRTDPVVAIREYESRIRALKR